MDESKLWNCVFPSPKLYGATRFLCLLGFIFSTISIGVSGSPKNFFGWLLFCIPVLWLLWLCCAFFIHGERSFCKLVFLWAIINAAIFALSISLSIADNWTHSRDQDVVVLILYFPVVMPVVFLLDVLPEWVGDGISNNLMGLAKLLGGSAAAEMTVIWAVMSVLTVIEAFGFIGLSQFFTQLVRK